MEFDPNLPYVEHQVQSGIIHVALNNMSIPPDPNNMDYWAYLGWKAQGGMPTIIDDTPPSPDYAELRRRAYDAAGVTIGAISVAMWEDVIESRPDMAEALQAIREAIKAQYPKP